MGGFVPFKLIQIVTCQLFYGAATNAALSVLLVPVVMYWSAVDHRYPTLKSQLSNRLQPAGQSYICPVHL